MWNKNICLTSRKTTLLIFVLLLSTLVLATVLVVPKEEVIETPNEKRLYSLENIWWVPIDTIIYGNIKFNKWPNI